MNTTEQLLLSPEAVHVNMLRGTIAKPSREQILHIYPEIKTEIERLTAALKEVLEMSKEVSSEDGGELLEALCKRTLGYEQSPAGKP